MKSKAALRRSKIARQQHLGMGIRAMDAKEYSSEYAGKYLHRDLPKSHKDFSRIVAHLCAEIEKDLPEDQKKRGISIFHFNIFKKLNDYAMREPFEFINRVKCSNCGNNTYLVCEACKKKFEIKLPNAAFEKNSMQALMKLADKCAPNLAAITQELNVNLLVKNVQEYIVKLIVRYVPPTERDNILNEFKTKITEFAEYEEQS